MRRFNYFVTNMHYALSDGGSYRSLTPQSTYPLKAHFILGWVLFSDAGNDIVGGRVTARPLRAAISQGRRPVCEDNSPRTRAAFFVELIHFKYLHSF